MLDLYNIKYVEISKLICLDVCFLIMVFQKDTRNYPISMYFVCCCTLFYLLWLMHLFVRLNTFF